MDKVLTYTDGQYIEKQLAAVLSAGAVSDGKALCVSGGGLKWDDPYVPEIEERVDDLEADVSSLESDVEGKIDRPTGGMSGYVLTKVSDTTEQWQAASGASIEYLTAFKVTTDATNKTEKFIVRCYSEDTHPESSSDISIDFGDNTAVINIKDIVWEQTPIVLAASNVYYTNGGTYTGHQKAVVTTDDNKDCIYYLITHTYSTVGTFKIKITGKDYWNVYHYLDKQFIKSQTSTTVTPYAAATDAAAGTYTLITECLTEECPLSPHISNITALFAGAKKLTSLNVSPSQIKNITNWSSLFKWCTNITSVTGLSGIPSDAKYFGGIFYSCTSLVDTDFKIPTNALIINSAFTKDTNLTTDINSILPATGFTNASVRVGHTFDSCSKIPATSGINAAVLWEDRNTMFTGSDVFTGATLLEGSVPSTDGWGGANSAIVAFDASTEGIVVNKYGIDTISIYEAQSAAVHTITIVPETDKYSISLTNNEYTKKWIEIDSSKVAAAGKALRFSILLSAASQPTEIQWPVNMRWETSAPDITKLPNSSYVIDVYYSNCVYTALKVVETSNSYSTASGIQILSNGTLTGVRRYIDTATISTPYRMNMYSGGIINSAIVTNSGSIAGCGSGATINNLVAMSTTGKILVTGDQSNTLYIKDLTISLGTSNIVDCSFGDTGVVVSGATVIQGCGSQSQKLNISKFVSFTGQTVVKSGAYLGVKGKYIGLANINVENAYTDVVLNNASNCKITKCTVSSGACVTLGPKVATNCLISGNILAGGTIRVAENKGAAVTSASVAQGAFYLSGGSYNTDSGTYISGGTLNNGPLTITNGVITR